jgi:hypothetical protein
MLEPRNGQTAATPGEQDAQPLVPPDANPMLCAYCREPIHSTEGCLDPACRAEGYEDVEVVEDVEEVEQ